MVRPVHHVQKITPLGHSSPASQTEGEKVTGTERRKGRRRTGQDGSTDRYTVVTGTERRRGHKRTGQDGNTDRYTASDYRNWKRKRTGQDRTGWKTEWYEVVPGAGR